MKKKLKFKKKKKAVAEIPEVEMSVSVTDDRLSVGGSIKVTRKTPSDVFVSIESMANLSVTVPKGKLKTTREVNQLYVREAVMDNLHEEIKMIRDEIGE